MTSTDEELVARSIGGDADSFNELILRWERPIYALAYRTIGREEDARDVCQETFLRAFRALPGFRGQAKFSSWLYRIALNLCRDWIRRERRTGFVQPPEDVDLMDLAAAAEPSESIEDLVARKDQMRVVERAMALLPEDQRTAIVLKEYHGLTFQEIADLLGCPLSTVKTRLYQGLLVLRRELEKTAAGPKGSVAGGATFPRGLKSPRRCYSSGSGPPSRIWTCGTPPAAFKCGPAGRRSSRHLPSSPVSPFREPSRPPSPRPRGARNWPRSSSGF